MTKKTDQSIEDREAIERTDFYKTHRELYIGQVVFVRKLGACSHQPRLIPDKANYLNYKTRDKFWMVDSAGAGRLVIIEEMFEASEDETMAYWWEESVPELDSPVIQEFFSNVG